MPLIKILLLIGIAFVSLAALRGGSSAGHRAFWRLAGFLVLLAGALSVLFPDTLTSVANALGVQRGTDLLLYVAVVTFMLTTVIMFRRLNELEQRYVALARRIALDHPMMRSTGLSEPGE